MTTLRSRSVFASASLVLVLALAASACSSTPSAPSTATLRQQFQAVVTSTDKALTRDHSVKIPAQSYAKYARDFQNASDQFHALHFPASMKKDAAALVAILHTMSLDATKVGVAAAKSQKVEANVVAMAKLNLALIEAEKTELVDSNAVRRDLGLPLETTTTTTIPTTTPASPTPPATSGTTPGGPSPSS